MITTEKLAAACFLENLKVYGNDQTEPEKYNLYRGLAALSETIEVLLHAIHKVETQLDRLNYKIDHRP